MTVAEMRAELAARKSALRRWLPALLVLLFLIAGGAIYSGIRPRADVRIAHPMYEDIASTVATSGTVLPVNDFPARANFTGLVEKIYVKLGQKVHAGQMLIQMKDQYAVPRLDLARATLDEAELNRENVLKNGSQEDRINQQSELLRAQTEQQMAANALDSIRKLKQHGSVSDAEVEAATQRLQTANSNLSALKQRLSSRYSAKDIASWNDRVRAERAQLQAEKVSWANANISSPVTGTVYSLPIKLYDYVPAGSDLLHVADLNHMCVRADFDESDIGRLAIGQPVTITWDGAPGRTWHGTLRAKPLSVARNGLRTVGESTIELTDDHGDLPVNTDVAVVVTTSVRHHTLSIPHEALHTEGKDQFVYRVVDGELVRTPVVIGLANAMKVEILKGLALNDTLALSASDGQPLKDHLKVQTVP